VWGAIAHVRVQVDTTPPEHFEIRTETLDPYDARARLNFSASDSVSGIALYEVRVDGGAPTEWVDDGSHTFVSGPLSPGAHFFTVRAIDGAGNALVVLHDVSIAALRPPTLLEVPDTLGADEEVVVRGSSEYEGATVKLFFTDRDGATTVGTANVLQDGSFQYVSQEPLTAGTYTLYAVVVHESGGESAASKTYTVRVRHAYVARFGTLAITYLALLIALAVLVIVILFGYWYVWHRYHLFKARVRREVSEARELPHRAYTILGKDIKSHVSLLERLSISTGLSHGERALLTRLRDALVKAERKITKELDDIDKRLR
jgi:hypothetical protein